MIRVLFVCHGNICRSPMAEFVFRDLAARRGVAGRFSADSAATSDEEIGIPARCERSGRGASPWRRTVQRK